MKKQILFLVMMLVPMMASAQSIVKIDGIYYKLFSETKEAEVTTKTLVWFYSGDIVIPSTVVYEDVEYRVTSIGKGAFSYSSELTSLTIPNSVTSIGTRIFNGCTGLTSIIIEEGNTKYDSRENCNAIIETASNNLLYGCKGTTIPNSVTSIGDRAFLDCSGLTSINIPNSVTSIGIGSFAGCSSLTKVELDNNAIVSKVYNYESGSSIKDIFGTQVKEYVLGEDVTCIGDGAFYDCIDLISVHMSDNVTSIGESAFRESWRLSSFRISANVTSIGDFAFYMCSGLTSITIPKGITDINNRIFEGCHLKKVEINSNALVSKDYGWSSLASCFGHEIEEFVLGEEITSIGKNAFNSSSVISINIAQNVTSIGEAAFSGCYRLSSIKIPTNVGSIGQGAFYNCTGLNSIQVESGNMVYDSRENCNALIETASNTLILGCQNTVIPNGVTAIGDNAFYMCSGLTSINIPNGVTSIGENAFAVCRGLTAASIPNSVTTIGKYAFSHCDQLTEITIPGSVTAIDEGAFFYCTGLTSITIPNSVTRIGDGAFRGCINLTLICIPNGVTSIGKGAFVDCYKLATVIIPNTVTTIGDYAFIRSGLRDMYCYAEQLPEIGSSIFQDTYFKETLHVPAEALEVYHNTEQWKDFPSIVALTDSDPTPTGIIATTTAQQPAKVEYYDLTGRRIASPPAHGIYIRGSRKYVR